jgi:hypothetical protein
MDRGKLHFNRSAQTASQPAGLSYFIATATHQIRGCTIIDFIEKDHPFSLTFFIHGVKYTIYQDILGLDRCPPQKIAFQG